MAQITNASSAYVAVGGGGTPLKIFDKKNTYMEVTSSGGTTMLYQDNGDGTMHMFGFYPYHWNGSDSISLPNGYVLNGNQTINTSLSLYGSGDYVYGMDGGNIIYLSSSSAGFSAITINTNIKVRKTN